MATNVCPLCKEVVLNFRAESSVRCLKCDTLFDVNDTVDDCRNIDIDKKQ